MLRRLAILAALAALLPAPVAAIAVPPVEAVAYKVVDPATGEALAERAPDRELPMASTTKIMTALIVLERSGLDDTMTVPRSAETIGGSTGNLVAGETLAVRDLVTALLVASGNDAAVTLARGVAGSQARFVDLMNEKARELGLDRTRYANPHGLDAPGHHTSASDLVRLSRVAMRDPFFRQAVAARTATIPGPGGVGVRELRSENELLDLDPGADGVKTGMTDDAGYTLVARSRRAPLGVTLYVSMIGSPSSQARARDAQRLLDWGFSQYARGTLVPGDAVLGRAPVDDLPGVSVPYRAARALTAPIRLGRPVIETLVAPTELKGPVSAGQVVGSITMRQGGHVVGRRDLVATEGAGEPGIWDRLRAGLGELVP